MKFIVVALALACAKAAEDSAPPVISLDLAATTPLRNSYYTSVSQEHALHSHVSSAAYNNVYARKCNVGVDTKDTCKSPSATAFDQHQGELTDDIAVTAFQIVVSEPNKVPEKPTTHRQATTTGTGGNTVLATAEYSKRGEFVLKYNVEDANGNEAEELTFAMIMVDHEAPTITPQSSVPSAGQVNVEACLEHPAGSPFAKRCTATGFFASATDNYDAMMRHFTFQVSGEAAAPVSTQNQISVHIKTLGQKSITYRATDFADIFGANNMGNVAQQVVSFTVVDTTPPRLGLAPLKENCSNDRTCGAAALFDEEAVCSDAQDGVIDGVNNLEECRIYTLTHNVPGLYDRVCQGCDQAACYKPGTGKMCYSIDTTTEKWECATTAWSTRVFNAQGQPQHTGAWCVDDRLSANFADNTNSPTAVAATVTGAQFNPDQAHGSTATFSYACTDGANTAAPKVRTVQIVDTTKPELFIVHGGTPEALRAAGTATSFTEAGASGAALWTDLTTVFHSAGYAEDNEYIAKLTQPGVGFTCTDTCAAGNTDKNLHTVAYKDSTSLGAKVEWFKCDGETTNCCDASEPKTLKGAFDPLSVGNWALTYTCGDGVAANTQVMCRNVVTVDHDKPIVTILNTDNMTFEASTKAAYVDAGATCQDNVDGNLSQNIEVSGDVVDLSRVGTYKIYYNCKDSAQNAAPTATRTVVVHDTTCPVCEFTPGAKKSIVIEASFPFVDPWQTDVKCSDEITPVASLTKTAVTKNDANTVVTATEMIKQVGTYFTTYKAVDAQGNTNIVGAGGKGGNDCTFRTFDATGTDHNRTPAYTVADYTRTIVVKDTLKPVIHLKLDDSEGNMHTVQRSDWDANQNVVHQAFPSPTSVAAGETSGHEYQTDTRTSLMSEETTRATNGWVLGAVASAVAGVALLGISLRKQAQPVATSVPV